MSAALVVVATASTAAAGPLVISEFRFRGLNPNGATNEYVEIYNATATDHTVVATSGTGYGLAASDGVTRATIPNGTVIPAHGHYLMVNSGGFGLGSYPGGPGVNTAGDATFTTNIGDNTGIALFDNNSGGGAYTVAARMDAVGFTSEANTLYKEGTGIPTINPTFNIDHAFYRDSCGKGGSITTGGDCPAGAVSKDTDNNAADFIFVDTNGTSAGAGQRLGAPGPENLASPVTNGTLLGQARLDTCVNEVAPNRVRDLTSDPANNSQNGTLDIRHTFTNNTGGNLTRLRFRIVDLTTFPAPSGFADLRPRTSTSVVVTVDRPPCGSGTSNITVTGTTLETPPSQLNGGGFNSSMSVGTITLGTPLADGASVDVRFLLGVQQGGYYKLGIVPEATPAAGFTGGALLFEGCTEGDCPTVTINQAAAQADPTGASPINFTVVFSESVTGFDAADVTLSGTAGATTATVTGSGATYNVAVSGMTASGTVIAAVKSGGATNTAGSPNLASTSTDNTVTFSTDTTPPTVTIDQATTQTDPTGGSPIHFTVVFSETVTGFTGSDVTLGGTALPTTATVTGSGATYDVAVSGMTANGTVTAIIPAGAAIDGASNQSLASTSTDNQVTFTGIDVTAPTVTINQDALQLDPTDASPIHFSVVFSEPVTGFDASDVVLGGTALPTTATVTGSGATYDVAVTGMTTNGTVTASLDAGAASDAAANPSEASTSTDNEVTFDGFDLTPPTVTIDQAATQDDPATAAPIHFTVVFSEDVTGFDAADVVLGGTALPTTAVVTGTGASYDVAVTGMTTNGTVTASIDAGAAIDTALNPSEASTSTDNSVTFNGFDLTPPTVTINQATTQADPTAASPIHFTVTFSETVTGFDATDVVLGGTAGATTAEVTGSGASYDVAVSGMTTNGTVTASIGAGAADDAASNASLASTSTDNAVQFNGFDLDAPTVVINRAGDQPSPTAASTVHFTAVFSRPVTGFDRSDLIIGGTAGATAAIVTGGPTTFDVAVSGMIRSGTVTVTIKAGGVVDSALHPNPESTSTDNTVAFAPEGEFCGDGVVQASEQCDDGNDIAGDGCNRCVSENTESSGGCGCSSTPDVSGVGLFALVMATLVAPRRRRRTA